MRKYLAVAFVVCCAAVTSYADDPILMITKKGYYLLTTDAQGEPQMPKKVNSVINIGTPGDTAPTPPETGGLVARISDVTKSTLKDASEAASLVTILKTFIKEANEGRLSDANVERTLSYSNPIADTGVEVDGRFVKWLKATTALSGFTYNKAGLVAMADGVTAAFNLPAGAFDPIADNAVDGYHAGKSEAEIVASVQAALPEEAAFDPTAIIQLIMQILKLLQDLGIFG